MEYPVLVTVAKPDMEDVEERALTTCPCPPSFQKQYVDNMFTALSEEVNQFLGEPTINFTMEESDRSHSFLDTS